MQHISWKYHISARIRANHPQNIPLFVLLLKSVHLLQPNTMKPNQQNACHSTPLVGGSVDRTAGGHVSATWDVSTAVMW